VKNDLLFNFDDIKIESMDAKNRTLKVNVKLILSRRKWLQVS